MLEYQLHLRRANLHHHQRRVAAALAAATIMISSGMKYSPLLRALPGELVEAQCELAAIPAASAGEQAAAVLTV